MNKQLAEKREDRQLAERLKEKARKVAVAAKLATVAAAVVVTSTVYEDKRRETVDLHTRVCVKLAAAFLVAEHERQVDAVLAHKRAMAQAAAVVASGIIGDVTVRQKVCDLASKHRYALLGMNDTNIIKIIKSKNFK